MQESKQGAAGRGEGRKFTDERYMSKSKKEKYLPCDNRERERDRAQRTRAAQQSKKDLELV